MWKLLSRYTAKDSAEKKDAKQAIQLIPGAQGDKQVKAENPRNIYNLYTTEFSGLSPDRLYNYLEAARKGVNWWKSMLFEEIKRRDMEIGGVCQTRKYSVAKEEYEFSFKKNSKVPEAVQQEIIYFLEEMFDALNIQNLFTDIVEAQIQGVSTFEELWAIKNGKAIVTGMEYIQNHLLCYDDINNKYRYLKTEDSDGMKMRLTTVDYMQDRIDISRMVIEELHPYKILEVHSLDGNAQNGFMNGCIDSLIWAYLFKNYGLKDWAIYIERFATPSIVVKYPALMGKDDKLMLREAVEKYGKLFKLLIPNDASFETITDSQKGNSTASFDTYTGYWDKKINIRVLGQTLTTGSGDGGGSYALGKVHNQVREDLQIADMMLVKDTINRIIKQVMSLNYFNLPDLPRFGFRQEKDIEYKVKRSEIIRNLSVSGWSVSAENIEEEFDFKVTERQAAEQAPGQQYIDNFLKETFNKIF